LARSESENALLVEIPINAHVSSISTDKHSASGISQRNVVGRARHSIRVKDNTPIGIDQRQVNPPVGICQDQWAEVSDVYRITLKNHSSLEG